MQSVLWFFIAYSFIGYCLEKIYAAAIHAPQQTRKVLPADAAVPGLRPCHDDGSCHGAETVALPMHSSSGGADLHGSGISGPLALWDYFFRQLLGLHRREAEPPGQSVPALHRYLGNPVRSGAEIVLIPGPLKSQA